ncbi:MAG: hypothetical protein ACR2P1_10800 [Pseudomonadales bacterium]
MKVSAMIVTVLVLAHHGIAYFHGAAHDQLQIPMATWQNVFINVVILVVPLIGVVLLWTKWSRWGLFGIMWAMIGALIFSIMHHYMLQSPDHISHLPAGEAHIHASFIWTASATAILEGLAAVAAAYFAAKQKIEIATSA